MLQYAELQEADLRGANLQGAIFLDISFTGLTGAIYDRDTLWPEGFDPDDWEAVLAP